MIVLKMALPHLSEEGLVEARALLFSIVPLSLVLATILEVVGPIAIPHVVMVLALVPEAVWPVEPSSATPGVSCPSSFVCASVLPRVPALAMDDIIFELSLVDIS